MDFIWSMGSVTLMSSGLSGEGILSSPFVTTGTNPDGTSWIRYDPRPRDVEPPTAINDLGLTVDIGVTMVITPAMLRFDDRFSGHSSETYTVTTPPQHGTLLKDGVATASFTQDDIDLGRISYQAGSAAGGDSFNFSVTDQAANTTAVFPFAIQILDALPILDIGEGQEHVNQGLPVTPFTSMAVTDDTPDTIDSLIVTMSDPSKGTLSNLAGGVYDPATGVYTLSGNAAALTAAIQGLTFTGTLDPPGHGEIVHFDFMLWVGSDLAAHNDFTVYTENPDHPAVIVSNGGGATASLSIPENTTYVTTVVATDQDPGQTLVYSIYWGDDRALFQIDPSTGVLSFITPPNFEAPGDADGDNVYVVDVQVFDGIVATAQQLTITVTDVGQTMRASGAKLASLSPADIAALAGQDIVAIDATDNVLTLSLAQLRALGSVRLTAADFVVVRDTGAALGALTPAEIAVLVAKLVDRLDASDDALTLSVAQVRALGGLQLDPADVVTLADLGAALAGLSAAEIAALAGQGIDRLHATDGQLSLSVAQFRALGSVQLTLADVVVLKDSGAALAAALSTSDVTALAGRGIDRLDASDDVLSLSVTQNRALGSVALTAADNVTLLDTGARLASLTPAELGVLAARGIDRLDASDDVLGLTVAQFAALGTVQLTPADQVILRDSAANLASLTPTQIARLASKGIDRIDAGKDVLALTVAQYKSLGTVALTAAGSVTLADTGAELANLSPATVAGLAGKGIDRIDATDDVLTLNVAQAVALGPVALTAADVITLADTGAHLRTLTAAQLAGLAKSADFVDATDNLLTLGLAQYQALGAMALSAADLVTLADTGAALAGMSPAGFANLVGKGIDRLDATDDALTLTLAQYQALGPVALTAADLVTLKASPSAIAGLGTTGLAALAGKGIDVIDSATDVLTLNVAQYLALGPVACAAGDAVTLADTGANLAAMPMANFAALASHGIDRIDATDNTLSLGLAQFNALGATLLAATDALTLAGTPDNDTIGFTSQPFSMHDRIDGGAGTDTLTLAGDYSAGLTFEAGTITNVERLLLSGGSSYKLTMADANVAAGQTLIANASKLGAADALVFDGSAETNGKFSLVGGAGSNNFTGGNGADSVTAGAGADLIRYTAASQSTSTGYDTVAGFDATKDKFQVLSGVAAVDPTIATGKLSMATFDADLAAAANAAHLLANHAVLFTPDSGALAGSQFLVVDANGVAGYQAGSDVVVRLTGATNLGAFGIGNFA